MGRVRDLAIASAALLLLLPLLMLIALMVWAVDGRPILFRQTRSGRHGVTFTVAKFRTMAIRTKTAARALTDAERITWLGGWLRTSRLDELPQLWSILVGDMSFVGPRPLLPETIAQGGEGARRRGMVRPGLTGWAQVNGNALLSDADKIALDQWYVANRSLGLDIEILARTILVVLRGERIDMSAIRRAHARGPRRSG